MAKYSFEIKKEIVQAYLNAIGRKTAQIVLRSLNIHFILCRKL